jgi:NADPH:quinone reductase-like Zn-dependent oxidoreductase
MESTRGQGVDIIIDIVGADYLERNIRMLAMRGRMVSLATLSGRLAELDLGAMMGRRLRLIGSVLRSRSTEEKTEIQDRFMSQFWPSMLSGAIKPVIDSVFPIEEAAQAHERMAENKNVGKIILKVR